MGLNKIQIVQLLVQRLASEEGLLPCVLATLVIDTGAHEVNGDFVVQFFAFVVRPPQSE